MGGKMKDEYIIINKKLFKKRIEELEKDPIYLQWEYDIKTHNGHSPQQRERKKIVDLELELLKEILSESTPLIPVVEKLIVMSSTSNIDFLPDRVEKIKQDCISNLKLDI